jgi:hypothetical protein
MASDEFKVSKVSVTGWFFFILVLVIVAGVTLTALSYAGVIFRTKLERKVFEESYQFKAGQRQKISIFEAQLAEINAQLGDPSLTPGQKYQLKSKRAAIRVQLRAARNR